MDDSSDLEFETMLYKIKSTCKKKTRCKMVNPKLFQSCPPRKCLDDSCTTVTLDHRALDESLTTPKCRKNHGCDLLLVNTGLKHKTPVLDLQLLLDSSDESIDENLINSQMKDIYRNTSRVTSPAKTPCQNLIRMLTDAECEIECISSEYPNDTIDQPTYNNSNKKTYHESFTNVNEECAFTNLDDTDCRSRDFNFSSPISSDYSDDKLEVLTGSLGRFNLKHKVPYLETPIQKPNIPKSCQQLSEKKVIWDNDLQILSANKHVQLVSKRPLNENDLDCTTFTPGSTLRAGNKTPAGLHSDKRPVYEDDLDNSLFTSGNETPAGLRNGYLGATSKKTPKNSYKFLLSSLDDSSIESNMTSGNMQQNNEFVDYSKPVLLHLYTKQGVNSFLAALSPENGIHHYDAQIYVYQYDLHKIKLAQVMYYFFNKFVFENKLPVDMTIRWKGLSSSAGNCECTRIPGTSTKCCTINLSNKLLDAADKLRDTLIHELCHAATYLISEERDVHGPFWRYWTRVAKLAFPDLPFITRCHSYK